MAKIIAPTKGIISNIAGSGFGNSFLVMKIYRSKSLNLWVAKLRKKMKNSWKNMQKL